MAEGENGEHTVGATQRQLRLDFKISPFDRWRSVHVTFMDGRRAAKWIPSNQSDRTALPTKGRYLRSGYGRLHPTRLSVMMLKSVRELKRTI